MSKTRERLLITILIFFALLARLGFLFNGLDSQRIWDTNTPDAFRFLAAAQEGSLVSFLAEDHKYPLLGSLFHLPTIGLYYLVNMALGVYETPTDFINKYAVGETNLFFWLRLEMLILQAVGVWALWRVIGGDRTDGTNRTYRTNRTALYLLALFAVNYYATEFAVTPRIHSFAFVGMALTLYASWRLLRDRSWRAYLFAFGIAGATAAVAQSGIVAMAMAVAAACMGGDRMNGTDRMNKTNMFRRLIIGVVLSAAIVLFFGYPQFVLRPFLGETSAPILSAEHQRPNFSVGNFGGFVYEYFYRTEFLVAFLLAAGVGWWVIAASMSALRPFPRPSLRGRGFDWEPIDAVAVAPVAMFLLVFGLADVTTGRFALVIVPPLLVLGARAWARLDKIKFVRYTAVFLFALQVVGILFLARIAWGGDTRAKAAEYILSVTRADDKIAITMDPAFAGLAPAPESVRSAKAGPVGVTDKLIEEKKLVGTRSRNLQYWNGSEPMSDVDYIYSDQPKLSKAIGDAGFKLDQEFIGSKVDSAVSWGYVRPLPFPSLPIVFDLVNYSALGPNVRVYRRDE